jgi:RNA polymerase primary sigma factor
MEEGELKAYIRQASTAPILSRDDELALAREATGAADAMERLRVANMRLVVSIARKYEDATVSLGDAVEAGDAGLRQAIQTYDPDAGHKLSAWATWYVRREITRRLKE